MGKRRFALLLFLLLSLPVHSLQGQASKPAPIAGQNAAYAESPEGLKNLVLDILKAKKAGDDATLSKLLNSMVLLDHQAWMVATFGEPMGKRIAILYGERSAGLPGQLATAFAALQDEGLTEIEIESRDDQTVRLPGEGDAPGILLDKKRPARLYGVRFLSADRQKSKNMWHFAYVEGGFRYLGHLRPAPVDGVSGGVVGGVPGGTNPSAPTPPPPNSPQSAPQRIRQGGTFMQEQKLVKMVEPKYPASAARARISGTVVLQVIVAKDGSVSQLDVVSGHALLVQAALDAVRQWRYRPTQLNGEPVEVTTTVTVVFELDKSPPKKSN